MWKVQKYCNSIYKAKSWLEGIFTLFLEMRLYAHLLAHIQHGAGGAVRHGSPANMFSKRHQKAIDLDPITTWESGFQCDHRLLRTGRIHVPPAIGYTMNMHVHADKRFVTGDPERQVGAFGSDT